MRQLEQMAIFAKVVEASSFTGAAGALGLPKSTVSTQISHLERGLGTQLLQRTTRSLHLTPAGTRYYEHCARMVEIAERANTEIGETQERPTGFLRVTAPVNYGVVILSPLAVEFLEMHRDLAIELLLLDRQVNLIEEGVDLAFRIGPMRDSSLVARRIMSIQHFLCVAPKYLAQRAPPGHPRDLRRHHCLAHESHLPWVLERDGETKRLNIKGRFSIGNLQGLKNAALAGLGIVRLPGYMCAEDLRSGKLIEVLEDWREPPVDCRAVYPSSRHLPIKVRGFLDFVGTRLS